METSSDRFHQQRQLGNLQGIFFTCLLILYETLGLKRFIRPIRISRDELRYTYNKDQSNLVNNKIALIICIRQLTEQNWRFGCNFKLHNFGGGFRSPKSPLSPRGQGFSFNTICHWPPTSVSAKLHRNPSKSLSRVHEGDRRQTDRPRDGKMYKNRRLRCKTQFHVIIIAVYKLIRFRWKNEMLRFLPRQLFLSLNGCKIARKVTDVIWIQFLQGCGMVQIRSGFFDRDPDNDLESSKPIFDLYLWLCRRCFWRNFRSLVCNRILHFWYWHC